MDIFVNCAEMSLLPVGHLDTSFKMNHLLHNVSLRSTEIV